MREIRGAGDFRCEMRKAGQPVENRMITAFPAAGSGRGNSQAGFGKASLCKGLPAGYGFFACGKRGLEKQESDPAAQIITKILENFHIALAGIPASFYTDGP